MRNDFAIFILTHNRADCVVTMDMLKRTNYSGKYYLLVDNYDEQIEKYKHNFGEDRVVVFDKDEVAMWTDAGDNTGKLTAILWARNVSFYIAEKLGLKYFMMLDDDYKMFRLKYVTKNRDALHERYLFLMEEAINMLIDFLDDTNSMAVAFAQCGDWIGGIENRYLNHLVRRKCMNSFLCRVDRKFKFAGRMNEDVTTYVRNAMTGKLMFTIMPIVINQVQTQLLDGGMSKEYKAEGTYAKSFYSVMYAPSAVKVSYIQGQKNFRIHHNVSWNNCETKIIREKYKKL